MDKLCQSALEDCIDFANQYNYDKEWVLDSQKQYLNLKRRL